MPIIIHVDPPLAPYLLGSTRQAASTASPPPMNYYRLPKWESTLSSAGLQADISGTFAVAPGSAAEAALKAAGASQVQPGGADLVPVPAPSGFDSAGNPIVAVSGFTTPGKSWSVYAASYPQSIPLGSSSIVLIDPGYNGPGGSSVRVSFGASGVVATRGGGFPVSSFNPMYVQVPAGAAFMSIVSDLSETLDVLTAVQLGN